MITYTHNYLIVAVYTVEFVPHWLRFPAAQFASLELSKSKSLAYIYCFTYNIIALTRSTGRVSSSDKLLEEGSTTKEWAYIAC